MVLNALRNDMVGDGLPLSNFTSCEVERREAWEIRVSVYIHSYMTNKMGYSQLLNMMVTFLYH